MPRITHSQSQWILRPPGYTCAPGGQHRQRLTRWRASVKWDQNRTGCDGSESTSCTLNRLSSDSSTDQDECVQVTGNDIGVVTVWVISLPPLSRTVTVSGGFFLLNTPFYWQGGVTQLQTVLMWGDACQSSGPPGGLKQTIIMTMLNLKLCRHNPCKCNSPEFPTVVNNFILWTEGGAVLQDQYFNTARGIAPPSRNHTLPLSLGLHAYVK